MSEEKKTRRYYVSGLVQGVGYRFFVHGAASRLGVSGFVRNLWDGRVEVYAIGTDSQLEALEDQLRRGPSHARVTALVVAEAEFLAAFAYGFSIEPEGER